MSITLPRIVTCGVVRVLNVLNTLLNRKDGGCDETPTASIVAWSIRTHKRRLLNVAHIVLICIYSVEGGALQD